MNNTCLRCLTASAGTIIRRDFLPHSCHSPPEVLTFTAFAFFCPWCRKFKLSLIDYYSRLLPSNEVWLFFIASGAVLSFNTAIDFWLVVLLPLQLPKLQTVLHTTNFDLFSLIFHPFFIPVFLRLSSPLTQWWLAFSVSFYPRAPSAFLFVLGLLICNVLNAPIVFALSQDQTLTLIGTSSTCTPMCFLYLTLPYCRFASRTIY